MKKKFGQIYDVRVCLWKTVKLGLKTKNLDYSNDFYFKKINKIRFRTTNLGWISNFC